jgi:hypothetical protein
MRTRKLRRRFDTRHCSQETHPLLAPVELATAELCLLATLRLVAEGLTRPVPLLVTLLVALLVLLLLTPLTEVLGSRGTAIDEMEVALLQIGRQ